MSLWLERGLSPDSPAPGDWVTVGRTQPQWLVWRKSCARNVISESSVTSCLSFPRSKGP